jgi:hypothetical protein
MKTISPFARVRSGLLLLALCGACTGLQAADAPTFKVGDFTFTRPAKWETVTPSSQMRAAQLKVPGADDKSSAEVVFFQFGAGQGGSVEANVDRWLGQFAEPREKLNSKVENLTVGKTKLTYVSGEGTYKGGMPGGPPATAQPDYALLGAIVGNPGDNLIFVRMTGPKTLVKSSTDDFKKMIEGGLK